MISHRLLSKATFRAGAIADFLEARTLLSSNSPEVLYTFGASTSPLGTRPESGIVMDGSGNLYGTTVEGGTDLSGTLYELPKGSTTPKTVVDFSGPSGTGTMPSGPLIIDSAGNIYGFTENSVFQYSTAQKKLTILASFDSNSGTIPTTLCMDSAGDLYGTTQLGGALDFGTVFEWVKGSAALTPLVPFNDSDPNSAGSVISGLIVDSAGNLWGTAASGSTFGEGSVFEVAEGSNAITVIDAFDGSPGLVSPDALVMDSQGNIFGTTAGVDPSATENGAIFKIPAGSTTATAIAAFSVDEGKHPSGGITIDSDGNLYGTTASGGNSDIGTVWELPNGGSLTDLAQFDSTSGPDNPEQHVNLMKNLLLSNGVLYGVTSMGGTHSAGVLYDVGGTGGGTQQSTADVSITSLADSLPDPFVPGDHAIAKITLHNSAQTTTRVAAQIQLSISPDTNPLDGVTLTTPQVAKLNVAIPAGDSRTFSASFSVPSTVAIGAEHIIAVISALSVADSATVDSTPFVEPLTKTSVLQFGTVGNRRNVKLVVPLFGDNIATLSLAGAGTGTLFPANDGLGGYEFDIKGTTSASAFRATGQAGFIGSDIFDVESPIGAIMAPGFIVLDSVGLIGGARLVELGDVFAADIGIGGSKPTTVVLGKVHNSSLQSSAPIQSLSVQAWDQPTTPNGIDVQKIGKFVDAGDFDGEIAASGIGSILIKGNLTGDILAGAVFGTNHELGGGDDVFNSGSIGSITVMGSADSSLVAAGLFIADDVFPLDGSQISLPGSAIRSIRIAGALSADSLFFAKTLPKAARIGSTTIPTAGDPRFAN